MHDSFELNTFTTVTIYFIKKARKMKFMKTHLILNTDTTNKLLFSLCQ